MTNVIKLIVEIIEFIASIIMSICGLVIGILYTIGIYVRYFLFRANIDEDKSFLKTLYSTTIGLIFIFIII